MPPRSIAANHANRWNGYFEMPSDHAQRFVCLEHEFDFFHIGFNEFVATMFRPDIVMAKSSGAILGFLKIFEIIKARIITLRVFVVTFFSARHRPNERTHHQNVNLMLSHYAMLAQLESQISPRQIRFHGATSNCASMA